MRVDIVTLFPGMIEGFVSESILGRAQRKGLVDIRLLNLRDFADDTRGTVDDAPFGGGAGMVLKPEPLFRAVASVVSDAARVLLMTPQGQPFKQAMARRLAESEHLVVLCGHYEGVDERVRQSLVHEEISIGDYVLTNGALAAAVVVDAIVRLVPGVLGSSGSAEEDSFGPDGLLDYPEYTRPSEFRGMKVPDVLLSGDHGRIKEWRRHQAELRTAARRPDLLTAKTIDTEISDECGAEDPK